MAAEPHGRPDGLDIPADLLDVDPERMRELGYWVVDRTIEHLTSMGERPAVSTADHADLMRLLGGPLPLEPSSVEEGLVALADVALENQQHGDHPRYFARVPGPSSYAAILGDWLAIGMQSIASSWGGGSGTSAVELVALEWLREGLGLPAGSEGILLSGGSMANITGLITARSRLGEGMVYLTDQTHSSIARGLTSMGQPVDLIRVIETDADFRLPPERLRAAIEADLVAGRLPRVVIATAGTTNTGAIDDLPAISAIAREHGMWLHVDGAYGGPAALSPGRNGIVGLELADSVVLDPHKWLFQPYDIACLFVSEPGALYESFAMHPEYLLDSQQGIVNFHNRGLELTRRSRAVKLWLTLRTYGMNTLVDAIDRGIALAEHAQRVIEAEPRFEVVTPAQLGIVTFTTVGSAADHNARIAAAVTANGFAAVSTTALRGRTVLRLCTINPRTTPDDITRTVRMLAAELGEPS